MSKQTWVETLVNAREAGASFGTFTTAKTVIPATALVTLRGGFFEIGRMLRIKVQGGIGNRAIAVGAPGTITFQVMIGGVIVFTTGAIQLNDAEHINIPFDLEIVLTCRAVGDSTSANLMGQGRVTGRMFTVTSGQVDGVNTHTTMMAPNTAAAVGTGFNSTIDNILDFWAGFSVSSGSNTVKIEQYTCEALN